MVGVMPLVSSRHAEYLHNEVPGFVVPQAVRDRVSAAGENAADLGVDMAVEFLDSARSYVQGAYIIPAVGRYDLAARVYGVRDLYKDAGKWLDMVAADPDAPPSVQRTVGLLLGLVASSKPAAK